MFCCCLGGEGEEVEGEVVESEVRRYKGERVELGLEMDVIVAPWVWTS